MVQIKSLLHWNQQFDITTGVYDKRHSLKSMDIVLKSPHFSDLNSTELAEIKDS